MYIANTIYRKGEGIPLILLHAFPADHRVWDAAADSLIEFSRDESFTICAPDMPGAGLTPVPTAAQTGEIAPDGAYVEALDRMADSYVKLMRDMGYEKAIFAGLSMGGYLALAIHRRHPQAVAGIALCDTKAAADSCEARKNRMDMAAQMLEYHTVSPVMHFAAPRETDSAFKRSDAFINVFTSWIDEQSPAGIAWRQRMAAGRADFTDELEKITVPASIVSGTLDGSSPPEVMRPIAEAMANASIEFTVVEDAGHFTPFEKPEIVAKALYSLVKRVQAEQGMSEENIKPEQDVRTDQNDSAVFDSVIGEALSDDTAVFDNPLSDRLAAEKSGSGESENAKPRVAESDGSSLFLPPEFVLRVDKLPFNRGGIICDIEEDGNNSAGKIGENSAVLAENLDRKTGDERLEASLKNPNTKFFLVRHGQAAVPKKTDSPMRLAVIPPEYVPKSILTAANVDAIYIGKAEKGEYKDCDYVALNVSRVFPEETDKKESEASEQTVREAVLKQQHMQDRDRQASEVEQFVFKAAAKFDWVDLRDFAPAARNDQATAATIACAFGAWHDRQRHCPECGCKVVSADGGRRQKCARSVSADGTAERRHAGKHTDASGKTDKTCPKLFPRIEPAVITILTDSNDRIILQHNNAWKNNLYTVCAGFVEAGESLEAAAERECAEELGVKIRNLKYLGSQAWPFPSSVMAAFSALASPGDIKPDGVEVREAKCFSRFELTEAIAREEIILPSKSSIARYMISAWYGSEL